jgi:hypothetical protein
MIARPVKTAIKVFTSSMSTGASLPIYKPHPVKAKYPISIVRVS